jgi:DNA-binding PadR family transcriptional regulator
MGGQMAHNLELSPVQLAIIVLLRSEDIKGNKYSPIPGKTHLIKELFAICKTELGEKILKDLKFEPDNFGPFDESIYAALDNLKEAGYVEFDPASSHYVKISLTKKGRQESDNVWKVIKDDIKFLFTYVKTNYNHLSSQKLLEKIYSAYPEMAVFSKSKIAEKYRPKESIG